MKWRSCWLHGSLIAVAVATVYTSTLWHGFLTWDDTSFVTHNHAVQSWSADNATTWLTSTLVGKWRPLTWASFTLDHSLWGLDPFGFRLHAVLLHLTSALLVLALGWHLQLAPRAALLAALLFALHPLAVEPVCWITARNYLIAQVGVLSAVLLAAREGRLARIVAVLALVAALAAHELAVVGAPLVVLDAWRRRQRHPFLESWPFIVAACWFGSMHWQMVQGTGVLRGDLVAQPPAMVAAELASWIWPVGLAPFYDAAQVGTVGQFIAAAVLLALAIGSLFLARRRGLLRTATFALGWTALCMLPTAGLLAVDSPRADRWMYLPGVGLALATGLALGERRGWTTAACWVVTFVLGGLSIVQSGHWRDTVTLWERAVAVAPSYLAHQNLAESLRDTPGPDRTALKAHHAAAAELAIRPQDRAVALTGGATLALEDGQAAEALQDLRAAVEADPRKPHTRYYLSLAYLSLQRPVEAQAQAQLLLAIDPDQPAAYQLAHKCATEAGLPPDEIAALHERVDAAKARRARAVPRH